MRALWRPSAWGCGATVALAAAIIASQSEVGAQRLQDALATVNVREQAQPVVPGEAQRLSETLRVLTAERDRLHARVETLERNLGTVTASAQAAPAPAQRDDDSGRETLRLAEAVQALISDRDRLLTRLDRLERNLGSVTGSIQAVPAPPPRRAPQRIVEPERNTAPDQAAASGIKFGVDLGGAPSMEMLRAQWAVAQTNYARLFEGLHPLAGIVESKPGMPELRLIVGPLTDIDAAAKLCAALAAMHASCRTAVFDGQKLALNELTVQGATAPVAAASCAGHPNALGTSRVLEVNADEFARIGTMQYDQTLPLADHEVVLTFDDGPLPPYTDRVLAALAAECVKATYFMVGSMANAYPDAVRRVYNDGHTIGTHSQHHLYTLASMSPENAAREISDGFASVGGALGDPKAVAPFFRFPGLLRVSSVEKYLAAHSIMTWSADLDADDWRKIGAAEVMHRALSRLEARGRGMILLHDIQPATALMLPALLKELKRRGYRIVQVVPSGGEQPKLLPVAAAPAAKVATQGWPRVASAPADGGIKNQ
jgi:peptidoglycan/xylan/chitin deacetylase (PgdA/CDA1 family)